MTANLIAFHLQFRIFSNVTHIRKDERIEIPLHVHQTASRNVNVAAKRPRFNGWPGRQQPFNVRRQTVHAIADYSNIALQLLDSLSCDVYFQRLNGRRENQK